MGKCCVTDWKNCKMSNNSYVTATISSSKHEIAMMIWWNGKVSFLWMESPFLKILPVCLSHLSKCHTTSFLEVRSQCTTFHRHNQLSNKCYTILISYIGITTSWVQCLFTLHWISDVSKTSLWQMANMSQTYHFCPFLPKITLVFGKRWRRVIENSLPKKKASIAKGIRLMSTTCEALHM